jgi:hypothetical protein
MQNLVQKINDAKIIQKEYWEDQSFGEDIDNELGSCKIVDSELDVDKHRWYETSITVYELNGEYFGIRYVTDTFSESSSIEDMFWTIEAFPMKAIQTTTYAKA